MTASKALLAAFLENKARGDPNRVNARKAYHQLYPEHAQLMKNKWPRKIVYAIELFTHTHVTASPGGTDALVYLQKCGLNL